MISFRDPATGAQVWQVTDGPAINHPSYFLQSSFFPGGRDIFFTSYRTGAAQLFEALSIHGDDAPNHARRARSIPSPPRSIPMARLWSSRAAANCGPSIAALWRSARIVQHAGAQLGECSISRDGEWLTAAFKSGTRIAAWSPGASTAPAGIPSLSRAP